MALEKKWSLEVLMKLSIMIEMRLAKKCMMEMMIELHDSIEKKKKKKGSEGSEGSVK